jgi:hypothetical protein
MDNKTELEQIKEGFLKEMEQYVYNQPISFYLDKLVEMELRLRALENKSNPGSGRGGLYGPNRGIKTSK